MSELEGKRFRIRDGGVLEMTWDTPYPPHDWPRGEQLTPILMLAILEELRAINEKLSTAEPTASIREAAKREGMQYVADCFRAMGDSCTESRINALIEALKGTK